MKLLAIFVLPASYIVAVLVCKLGITDKFIIVGLALFSIGALFPQMRQWAQDCLAIFANALPWSQAPRPASKKQTTASSGHSSAYRKAVDAGQINDPD